MSESWKNRLWSLLLVCTFTVVLSFYSKALDSSSDGSKKSSGGIAYADFKPSDITAVMYCKNTGTGSGVNKFYMCDSSDDTSIDSSDQYSITLGNLITAGFRPCAISGIGSNSDHGGHLFFFK